MASNVLQHRLVQVQVCASQALQQLGSDTSSANEAGMRPMATFQATPVACPGPHGGQAPYFWSSKYSSAGGLHKLCMAAPKHSSPKVLKPHSWHCAGPHKPWPDHARGCAGQQV